MFRHLIIHSKGVLCNSYMYKYKYKAGDNFINEFLEQINRLKINNINPIYVFDGAPPVEKKPIIENRKERKNMYKERIKTISNELDKNKYTDLEGMALKQELHKIKKKLISITADDISRLQYFLNIMNIPYIKENTEADLVCSQLSNLNIVDFVISEDMDHLTSGTRFLLRDFNNKNNYVTLYSITDALNSLEISKDKWIEMCIFLGCDYLPRIRGFGYKSVFKMIKNNINISYKDIIILLNTTKKFNLPEKYLEKFEKAKTIFENTQPITFKEETLITPELFDNEIYVIRNYLSKYTQLSDKKINYRIKNIFNYSI